MQAAEIPLTSRMDRKKEETRRKIIAVAMELFERQGFGSTGMDQIAEEVDIAKGTLYNYFPAKEAILSEFMQRNFRDKFDARTGRFQDLPDTRARMTFIFSTLLEGIERQKEIFERYMVYRIQSMLSFRLEEGADSGFSLLGLEIIRLGQKNGDLRSDLPPGILEDLFEFAFITAAKRLYLEPDEYDLATAIERSVELFINGAGAPAVIK
jgi:AcrR family transcriptional regulator